MSATRNEGAGNKTAAREYNEAQRRFVSGGKGEAAARDTEQALEGPEQEELRAAEAIGKSRAAPDPETEDHRVRARAYDIWENVRVVRRGGMTSIGARRSMNRPARPLASEHPAQFGAKLTHNSAAISLR
jgi:hypothetical protein